VTVPRDKVEAFPARLKEVREDRGWNRDRLAVAAGTSSHSIAKLEQGERAPSLALGWKLAQALECSLDELCREKGEPKKPRKRKG
jgi:XRE family transcriptional regulator, regulator of sulfur utilization